MHYFCAFVGVATIAAAATINNPMNATPGVVLLLLSVWHISQSGEGK